MGRGERIMSQPVLVDTDVLVDYLCGQPLAISFFEIFADRIILSPVVVTELYAGVKGEAERVALDDFLALFPIVPVSLEISRLAGLYRRTYGPTHGIGLADAILAVTARTQNAELKTLSIRNYPMFEGLRPAYKK